MQKTGFCRQGQGQSNWISVHTMKYDHLYYMFWTADFFFFFFFFFFGD